MTGEQAEKAQAACLIGGGRLKALGRTDGEANALVKRAVITGAI